MKKKINILFRILVMAIVFVLTVYFVNVFENRNYKGLATEMKDAELPLAYVSYGDSLLNCMHGYTGDVDLTLLRDSITPIDDSKNIDIVVDDSNNYAQNYAYEIRSIAGDSLVEKGDVEPSSDESGHDVLSIQIRMDLKKDMEYMLVVKMKGKDDTDVSYYTRVVVGGNYHESEIINAVNDFHDATFSFDTLETESVIGTYKQEYMGAATGDSYGLGHVNLANSYTDILWDGLKPSVISQVDTYIKEIDVNYAVIEKDFRVKSTTDQDVTSYYLVKEFYKLGYSEVPDTSADEAADIYGTDSEYGYDSEDESDAAEVTYVPKITMMSYDRYVDEYFDRSGIDAVNNIYEIGIVSSDDLDYKTTDDNKKIAFVRNGQLWLYDYAESQITMVYGFDLDEYKNDSDNFGDHDMNIIDLDKDGNMIFAVYGYMNRGDHEGRLGITLYTFDYVSFELDELMFVECNVPYEAMKNEVKRLTYYDGNNFYFMLGDKVNVVNIEDGKQSYIAESLSTRDIKVASNMQVIAFGDTDIQKDNTHITLMNLKTGKSYDIQANDGECLVCYGFKDSDMVYGVSSVDDSSANVDTESFKGTKYSEESRDIIPASRLYIVNDSGEEIKEYNKPGYYLMQVDVNTNLLYLTRGEKTGDKFVAVEDDFITFKADDTKETVSVTYKTSVTGYDRLYFTVPSNIYLSYIPSLNITRQRVDENAVSMITTIVRDKVTYHVYDNLGLSKIYDVAGDAINYAASVAGIVVSSEGEVIYRQSESQEYNTIAAGIFHHSSGSVDGSLTDCLYMVLTYEGVAVTEQDIAQYSSAMDALNGLGKKDGIDITGLSLDMILGYVSDGIPVISRIDDGRYVLVVSYNDADIRYYDPVVDEEIVVSREEYDTMMSACRYEAYTYVTD